MIYEIYGRTEQGPFRERNEDHIVVGCWIKNRGGMGLLLPADDERIARPGLLLAVADGMGGSAGGATASRVALDSLLAYLTRTTSNDGSSSVTAEDLHAAVQRTNLAIREAQSNDPHVAQMGTTLSAVFVTASAYWVLHVGDSRVLRIRNGFVKSMTRDDNLAEQLYRAGVAADIAHTSPDADSLVNWLGSEQATATVQGLPLPEAGDHLVICSDGLHRFLDEDTLVAALSAPQRPLPRVAESLVADAIRSGSNDNISLIVLRAADDADLNNTLVENTHGP
jgi:protein phosphatase